MKMPMAKGISIVRLTLAKYRDEPDLLPSNLRRVC